MFFEIFINKDYISSIKRAQLSLHFFSKYFSLSELQIPQILKNNSHSKWLYCMLPGQWISDLYLRQHKDANCINKPSKRDNWENLRDINF